MNSREINAQAKSERRTFTMMKYLRISQLFFASSAILYAGIVIPHEVLFRWWYLGALIAMLAGSLAHNLHRRGLKTLNMHYVTEATQCLNDNSLSETEQALKMDRLRGEWFGKCDSLIIYGWLAIMLGLWGIIYGSFYKQTPLGIISVGLVAGVAVVTFVTASKNPPSVTVH